MVGGEVNPAAKQPAHSESDHSDWYEDAYFGRTTPRIAVILEKPKCFDQDPLSFL